MPAVAPAMFAQLAPAELQRRHWYVYVIGAVPVHVPFAAVSVCSSCAVPEIVGSTVLTGGAAATTAVWADVAEELPAAFVPVTTTRTVDRRRPA